MKYKTFQDVVKKNNRLNAVVTKFLSDVELPVIGIKNDIEELRDDICCEITFASVPKSVFDNYGYPTIGMFGESYFHFSELLGIDVYLVIVSKDGKLPEEGAR